MGESRDVPEEAGPPEVTPADTEYEIEAATGQGSNVYYGIPVQPADEESGSLQFQTPDGPLANLKQVTAPLEAPLTEDSLRLTHLPPERLPQEPENAMRFHNPTPETVSAGSSNGARFAQPLPPSDAAKRGATPSPESLPVSPPPPQPSPMPKQRREPEQKPKRRGGLAGMLRSLLSDD